MNILVFENSGTMDIRSISTFGLNVKDTKNPIGFFGTGLKYALAVLLRTGCKVSVQCGLDAFNIISKKDTVRGKEFEFAFLDGPTADMMPLGFTTELGKTWEVWMAYRELFCNMKDEAGTVYEAEVAPGAMANITRVIVEGESLCLIHRKRDEFILEGPPDFTLGTLEVRQRPSQNFFYRGIKIMEFRAPAFYTYNETGSVELTEDRTAKDPWHIIYGIARAILRHADRAMLEKVLVADEEHIEYQFDFHGWTGTEPGCDFFPTVAAIQRHSLTKLNATALRLWREKAGGFIDPRRIHPTKIQLAILRKAIAFCEQTGFMLKDEYPIIIVETLGEDGVLAIADVTGKQIFLTERLFLEGGTKKVARALIEEYLHLKFKFSDCSREMQNFIFDKMISLAEELTGEPL